MFDKPKFKRGAFEDIDPVPYKKPSKKNPPKKADHKHQYEPIILMCFNPRKNFSSQKGFTGDFDIYPGRRCSICQRLDMGFPEGFDNSVRHFFLFDKGRELIEKHPDLPIVYVEDIWNLHDEKKEK